MSEMTVLTVVSNCTYLLSCHLADQLSACHTTTAHCTCIFLVDKSMIDEYTELALLLSYESANNSVLFLCVHTLRLIEDSIVIHRKVEVVRFKDWSDCEFPT